MNNSGHSQILSPLFNERIAEDSYERVTPFGCQNCKDISALIQE